MARRGPSEHAKGGLSLGIIRLLGGIRVPAHHCSPNVTFGTKVFRPGAARRAGLPEIPEQRCSDANTPNLVQQTKVIRKCSTKKRPYKYKFLRSNLHSFKLMLSSVGEVSRKGHLFTEAVEFTFPFFCYHT